MIEIKQGLQRVTNLLKIVDATEFDGDLEDVISMLQGFRPDGDEEEGTSNITISANIYDNGETHFEILEHRLETLEECETRNERQKKYNIDLRRRELEKLRELTAKYKHEKHEKPEEK